MAYKREIKWTDESINAVDTLMENVREAIERDAECFAKVEGEEVSERFLELALYKAIMTLNETNKLVMFKKLGPVSGSNLIASLEMRAITDVTQIMFEDLKKEFGGDIPEQMKDIFKNFGFDV